jgi:hypothetical protein
MQAHLRNWSVGPQPRDPTAFQALQCGRGYQGQLCGECAPGYGMFCAELCRPCPERSTNTILFALMVSHAWPALRPVRRRCVPSYGTIWLGCNGCVACGPKHNLLALSKVRS